MQTEDDGVVTLLGVRGSCPVWGPAFARYGGSTACVFVQMGGQSIVLDAGTGLLSLADVFPHGEQRFSLLLSHPHVDHLMGLPLCPLLQRSEFSVSLYSSPRDGRHTLEQVAALLAPPLWPVGPESFAAHMRWEDLPAPMFALGAVEVRCLEVVHPGGSTAFRLSCQDRSLVYVSDAEESEYSLQRLVDFAAGCSLLLIDGQFTKEELTDHQGYGHMAWETAVSVGRRCGAEELRIIHHPPERTDRQLDEFEERLFQMRGDDHYRFARCGERICL